MIEGSKLHTIGREIDEPFDRTALQARWTALRRHGQVSKTDVSAALSGGDTFKRLAVVRQLQIELGDVPNWPVKPEVFVGYSAAHSSRPAEIDQVLEKLANRFPFDVPEIDVEVGRLFSMANIDDQTLVAKVASRCTAESSLEQDIHYLIVLSRLTGERHDQVTSKTASALALLHHKLAARGDIPSRNWPLRVGELFDELCKKDDTLAPAVAEQDKFGLPEHSLFVSKMSGDVQLHAARKLLDKINAAGDEWDTDLLAALKILPADELRPHLLEKFNEPALRDAIALILAESPTADTRAHLVEALSSVQPNVVRRSAAGLLQLNGKTTPEEIGRALTALRQQTLSPNEAATRQALTLLLRKWTGQGIDIEEKKGARSRRRIPPLV